jgi:hypothetical protein
LLKEDLVIRPLGLMDRIIINEDNKTIALKELNDFNNINSKESKEVFLYFILVLIIDPYKSH